ncbi:MAG: hypothetical protein OIF36_02440 [Alphaproteobacteria bacterium]|nr:hypothetical protein [Alphaproteobacteria bacterium]
MSKEDKIIQDMVVDDQITCAKLKMEDIINNRLPIALENLDFSHMIFEDGKIPDLSFMEVRNSFDCSHTNICSFEGFPKVHKNIDISNTKIRTLEGCPATKELEMSYTEVGSFEHCPESVEIIDAWKTNISNFNHIPEGIKKLSVGRTSIRDLKNCPESIEDLTVDYLDLENFNDIPKNVKILSIAGSSMENFKDIPQTVEELTCYHNNHLNSLEGLNIEILKGIAIIDCPNVLEEEIDAYHKIIKARTLLEKQEILREFLSKKDDIIRQKELERIRRQFK